MKKGFQKSVSTVLALLVLVSTFSFTVDKHFCGSFLVDQAVFSKASTCSTDMHSDSCSMDMHSHSGTDVMDQDNCCSNQNISVEGQDELKISFNSMDFDQQVFIAAFPFSFNELFGVLPQQVILYKNYTPPLIVKDIPVLNDTFLI
ncbi:MAG: HYC_CC_PP family protein [Bacteroidota bacterium]